MNSSESILDLFKKDENRAFQLLFNRYYDNLLLYCYHISGNLEAAEDIVQDYGIVKDSFLSPEI